jgi:hypothetical protein
LRIWNRRVLSSLDREGRRTPPRFVRPVAAAALACLAAFGCGPTVVASGPNPGVSREAYLSANTPAMTVEVIPTTNHTPTQGALDLLVARIGQYCNKPGGVQLQVDPVVNTTFDQNTLWSYDSLIAFEQQNATVHMSPGTAALNVFYLAGRYQPNLAAIAISYTDHSYAIFTDMISPGGPEGPALVHEFGHEMGLVNGTTPELVAHEASYSTLHDVSTGCVMYFSLDPQPNPATPTDYCQNCQNDLQAAGAKSQTQPSPN